MTMAKFTLRLYVAGQSPRSEKAIANLQALCRTLHGEDEYELVIIDVLERPELAEDEKIMATPTLIKDLPPPLKRVVGDLSDLDNVVVGLALRVRETEMEEDAQ